jgi:hypothetical protein
MYLERLVLGAVVGSVLTVLGSVASATPPIGGEQAPAAQRPGSAAPLVGRVRIRGQVIDLTVESLASGGKASELAPAYAATVHADIDPALVRRLTGR